MLTIIAPFPKPGEVREGWMSRIAAVDRIFSQERRCYVQIVDDDTYRAPEAQSASDLVDVYYLNLSYHSHYEMLRRLVIDSEMTYVHTIHLARYVVPFYQTGKIVTDIHGVTPEEELLYARPEVSRFYEEIERTVLCNSAHAVVVTNAMADHYRKKYPEASCHFTILPIFETIFPRADQRLNQPIRRQRPKVLYSGAAQEWQKVDMMLDLAREQIEQFEFKFLSNEPETFQRAARIRGIEGRVTIFSVRKDELEAHYLDADYGLVLRDDITVNRVACPTKLSEYLWFGIIPIVLCADLGDFKSLGYRYVTYEDFRKGRLPSEDEQLQMRKKNFEVISTVQGSFDAAATNVRGLKSQLPQSKSEVSSYLTDFERNVVFPGCSELHVTFVGDTTPACMYTDHFIESSATVEFTLDGGAQIQRLSWMPLNRQCRIRLKSLSILSRSGSAVKYTLSGNYDYMTDDIIKFSARYPRINLDFTAATGISKFSASFDILYDGKYSLIDEEGTRPAEKEREVEELLNSLSWRITAPLRKVHGMLRGVFLSSK